MLANQTIAWMLTYLLHSTLLLGLAWLASKPLSRWSVAAEEAVWKLALVGAIFTASLQFASGWEPVAGRWSLAQSAPMAGPAVVEKAAIVPEPAVPLRASRAAEIPVPATEAPAPAKIAPPSIPALALGVWGLGMLALLAAHGASYLRLRRRLRPRPRVIGGTLFSQLRGLAVEAGIAEDVRLTCSSRVPVPLAFGREICVPPRALAGLTDEQQEGMLAHELAHLVRRDPFWLVVSQAVSCVLFFQPLNWVARRRLREISEMLSDEWAVSRTGRPLSLAGCLAEVAGWSSAGSAIRALPVPGMADRPSNLGRRIRRLLDETRSPEHPARRFWLGAAMVVLVISVAAAAPAVSAARGESPARATAPERAAKAQTPEPPQATEHHASEGEHDVAEVEPEHGRHHQDVDQDSDEDSYEFDADEIADQVTASVDAALAAVDDQLAGLSEDRELSQEERERLEREMARVNEKLERELGPRMEQLSRELAEKMAHVQETSGEMGRLQAEMENLAERMRPSGEEMARLEAQIDEQVKKMRADGELSREEREQIVRNAREMTERMKPTEEQRRQMQQLAEEMRKHQREMAKQFKAEHIEEIQKAQREMREEIEREMQAVREEVRRSLEQQRLRQREEIREHREERRREIHKEREHEDGDQKPPKVSVLIDPDPRVSVRFDPNVDVQVEAKDSSGH
jgi:beta-lactamase regulating signal transducer with metallopeptidase domain